MDTNSALYTGFFVPLFNDGATIIREHIIASNSDSLATYAGLFCMGDIKYLEK
jgi:hypothetical protein